MKYIVCATYSNADVTTKTNDLDLALTTFIEAYQVNDANHVNITDSETGEVYAIFDKATNHIWQADEITNYMVESIAERMVLELLGSLAGCPPCEDAPEEPEPPREVVPTIFEVMSALCGQQIAELGLSPEEAFLFPAICPSDGDSEIVS